MVDLRINLRRNKYAVNTQILLSLLQDPTGNNIHTHIAHLLVQIKRHQFIRRLRIQAKLGKEASEIWIL